MEKSGEMLRMEQDMRKDEELAAKFKQVIREAAESGECKSGSEAMIKAAASLGYDISAAELERLKADNEQLDLDEMADVTGGSDDSWCLHDYACFTVYKQDLPSSRHVACSYDWKCVYFWKHEINWTNNNDSYE